MGKTLLKSLATLAVAIICMVVCVAGFYLVFTYVLPLILHWGSEHLPAMRRIYRSSSWGEIFRWFGALFILGPFAIGCFLIAFSPIAASMGIWTSFRESLDALERRKLRQERERLKESSKPAQESIFTSPIELELYKQLDSRGLRLKTRNNPHSSHSGAGYMVVDPRSSKVVAGRKPYPYSLTLEQLKDWVRTKTAQKSG